MAKRSPRTRALEYSSVEAPPNYDSQAGVPADQAGGTYRDSADETAKPVTGPGPYNAPKPFR